MGRKARGRIRAKGERKPVKAIPRDDDAGGIFTSKVVVIVNKAKEKNNG